MGYAAAADALMRRKLLEQMYDRMTDEEKRLFAMMTMQNKSNGEILQAIRQNQQHLQHLVEHADRELAIRYRREWSRAHRFHSPCARLFCLQMRPFRSLISQNVHRPSISLQKRN